MSEISTGRMIRVHRERRGMSTTALGAQSGCTTRHIELIEQGRRTPSIPLLREIARVLGVRTAVLLGESPRDSHEPSRPQIADIEKALFTYRTLMAEAEPVDAEQLIERVTAARDAWFTSANKYSLLMRALPGLIRDAEHHVSGTPAAQVPDACRVAAHAYILARGVLKHLGRIDLSHVAADRAMRYAEATDDALMIGWAHWNLGQSLLSDDMHEGAYDIGQRGIERLAPLLGDGGERHFAVAGGLHQLSAIAAVRRGDDEGARETLRVQARALAEHVDESRNHLGLAFGPTNVAIHMVSIESEAREPEAAIRLADEIDLTATPSVERRTTHLMQVARACEDVGDDAASLIYLLRIERECPEELDHKLLLRQMVQSLVRRARPSWAPEVRYLAERHKIFT